MQLAATDWQLLSALFDAALDIPPPERLAWLASRDDIPAHLQPLVVQLFSGQETNAFTLPRLDRYSDTQIAANSAEIGVEWVDPAAGHVIGPYRLIREIGVGGMGSVWLAERSDGTFQRQVALKLPHSSLPRRQLAERFARECQILAGLIHPHIARLYDAGLTDDGRPWLAMEYVTGRPIDEYCRAMQLDLPARLHLFKQVIRAVQYAHSQLVVHRDLKPGNILITDEGHVRLLDFGIAKLLAHGTETPLTEMDSRALTPQYAAPEQILGTSVGTGADIYALGTLLYELLAGTLPYRLKRDSRGAWEDAVMEGNPNLPSQAGRNKVSWAHAMAGDLDTILLKSLKKDPQDRYATAEAFAEDIDRWLNGAPVLAQPDSAWYRTRKFISRHRWGVLSATAIVLALTIGLGVAMWQASIAREQALTAMAVEEFITGIFLANSTQQPDPVKARDTTARQLLDIGAQRIDTALADAPKAKIRMLKLLSTLYSGVGLDDTAATYTDRQLALSREIYGQDSPETVEALLTKQWLVSDTPAQPHLRRDLLDEIHGILTRRGDSGSPLYAEYLIRSARYWTDRSPKRALTEIQRAVDIQHGSAASPDTLMSAAAIAHITGDYAAAHKLASAGVSTIRSVTNSTTMGNPGDNLPALHTILGDVAWIMNDLVTAEREYRTGLADAERVFGPDDSTAISVGSRLAEFLYVVGAEQESRRLLDQYGRSLHSRPAGEAAWLIGTARIVYGRALAVAGKHEEALQHLIPMIDEIKGLDASPVLADYLRNRVVAFIGAGRFPEARSDLQRAIAMREKAGIAPRDVMRLEALFGAQLLLASGQPAAADALLTAYVNDDGDNPSTDGIALQHLRARCAQMLGHPEEARTIATRTLAAIANSAQRPLLQRHVPALTALARL